MAARSVDGSGRCPPILVIGYGNLLRGDDGAGVRLVELLAQRQLPHIQTLTVAQLVPELAEAVARSAAVIFVDAAAHPPRPRHPYRCFGLTRLRPRHHHQGLDWHFSDPHHLLALAESLYGFAPPAWLITLPAENFDSGDQLSLTCRQAVERTLEWLSDWLKLLLRRLERYQLLRGVPLL